MGRDDPRRGAVVHSTIDRRCLPQTAARRTRARARACAAVSNGVRGGVRGDVTTQRRTKHRGEQDGSSVPDYRVQDYRAQDYRAHLSRAQSHQTKRELGKDGSTVGRQPRSVTQCYPPTRRPTVPLCSCPIQARSGSSVMTFLDPAAYGAAEENSSITDSESPRQRRGFVEPSVR